MKITWNGFSDPSIERKLEFDFGHVIAQLIMLCLAVTIVGVVIGIIK